MHPQTLRIYEQKGLVRPKRTRRQHAPLLRRRPRAAAADPAADDRARAQPRRRRARAPPRGRARSAARAARAARAPDARGDPEVHRSTGATSCSTEPAQPSRRNDRGNDRHGLQQADAQEPGGGRRRAGARAPRAATPRSIPSTCCSRCSTRSCFAELVQRPPTRCAPRPRRAARPTAIQGAAAAAAGLGRVLARARPRRRRARASSRTTTSRPSTCCSRSTPSPRDELLAVDQGGARRPARHLAGSRGHLPGAREVRPRPDRGRRGRASSTR